MINSEKKKVIAIVGPTASGKTGIGIRLAKEFDGEIVSADSRQVFRGLDLGTGKDLKEYDGVEYHLIDIANPGDKLTLFDYLPLARNAIQDIFSRGKTPIIVGGTGLYVQGIVEGFELRKSTVDNQKLTANYSREQLEQKTVNELNEILQKVDPTKYDKVDRKNRHRLERSIELAQEGMVPIKVKPDFEVLQIALDLPRQELHDRIDRRVDERFEQGMLREVKGLLDQGIDSNWLAGLGLEYREITNYLIGTGAKDLAELKQQLKYKIHQFARRQITWFKRFPEMNWLSNYNEIKRFVKIFLEH